MVGVLGLANESTMLDGRAGSHKTAGPQGGEVLLPWASSWTQGVRRGTRGDRARKRGPPPKRGFQHPVLGQRLLGSAGAIISSKASVLHRALSQAWAVAGEQGNCVLGPSLTD